MYCFLTGLQREFNHTTQVQMRLCAANNNSSLFPTFSTAAQYIILIHVPLWRVQPKLITQRRKRYPSHPELICCYSTESDRKATAAPINFAVKN